MLEEQFKPMRPRLIKPHENSDWFYLMETQFSPPAYPPFKGRYIFGAPSLGQRQAGRGKGEPNPALAGDVGATDPHTRIKDMDLEGRTIDVLYGTNMLMCNFYNFQNPKYVSAICRAYNNWLGDYCKAYPARLKGIAVVSLLDVEAAVDEIKRCVTQLGFVGVMIAPAYVKERNLDDPIFYPFYEEVQALNIPIGIHIALLPYPPKLERITHDSFPLSFALVTVPHIIALGQLIFGGLLDRFPKLRFAFLESGVGWVPYWMERFDEKYNSTVTTWGPELQTLKKVPSDYIKSEQLFFACEPDEQGLPYAIQVLGDDGIIYSSDYPHRDALFPKSVACIANNKGLADSSTQKILQTNAARLYGIEI